MGGRRGEPRDERLREVLAHVPLLAAVARNRKRTGPEDLGLGHVGQGVEVDEVRGRAVGLLAGLAAHRMTPVHPDPQVVRVELRERRPVVGLHAGHRVGIPLALERPPLGIEVVAMHFAKRLGHLGRPVRLILERVVELTVDRAFRQRLERRREGLEIPPCRRWRIRVDHEALAAWRGPLHLEPRGLWIEPAILAGDLELHVVGADMRTPERPASARGHVYSQPEPGRLGTGEGERGDVLRREKRSEPLLGPLRPVDRRDLHAAESRRSDRLQFPSQVRLIDRAAQPPPAGPRPTLRRDRGPGGVAGGITGPHALRGRQRAGDRRAAEHEPAGPDGRDESAVC